MPKYINADKLKIDETAAFENVQPKVSKIDRDLNFVIHTKLHMLLDDAPAENVRPYVPADHEFFPTRVKNPEKIPIYDLLTIIRSGGYEVRAERIVSDNLTLADIKTHKDETVIVIAESCMGGEVYRYGNHGNYWEQIGKVCGYA